MGKYDDLGAVLDTSADHPADKYADLGAVPDPDPVAPVAAPPAAPHRTVDQLTADKSFNEIQHALDHPDDFETAFQVHEARKPKSVGQWLGGALAATPHAIASAPKGVWNFITGLTADNAAVHLSNLVSDAATGNPAAATEQAHLLLSGQHGEESVKRLAHAIPGAKDNLPNVETDAGIVPGKLKLPKGDKEKVEALRAKVGGGQEREEFQRKVQEAKNALQLSKGIPLDTGALAGMYRGIHDVEPSEQLGPEALKDQGSPPVNLESVERTAAGADPNNVLLTMAPQLPYAKFLGGGATELAGKTIGLTGKAVEATAGAKLNPFNWLRKINPTAIVMDAVKEKGGKGLQKIGDILTQQGKELRTGAPSALTEKAAIASAVGERAIGTNIQRKIGDTIAHGATTAVGMAPLNLALSEGDPQQFVELEAGAAAFGGALSGFRRNRPMLVEAVRPYLRSEGARALWEGGEGNDPLAAKTAEFLNTMDPEARNRALEVIGALQGLPVEGRNGKTRAKLYILNQADYLAAQQQVIGGQQSAMGGGRGFFHGPDGAAFINGEYHAGRDNPALELAHTAGHEFGGHAAINILRAAGDRGGVLYDGLINAAKKGLYINAPSAQRPYGTITPEFKRFIDGYNLQFDPTGKTKRIDIGNPDSIEEFLSETAAQILSHRGAGEIAVPRNIQDKMADGMGRFMSKTLGIGNDPDHIGTPTKFGREEVGSITRAMQETLSQIAGMKLREGMEIPEAPKSRKTRLAELNDVLAKPKPGENEPHEATQAWLKERAAARQEIAQLESDGSEEASAPAAPAPIVSPEPVTQDAMKMLGVMGVGKSLAANLIRQANQQHGEPITDPGKLAAGALRIRSGGAVKPGEFIAKPEAPKTPVPVPAGDKATFTDETGTKRVITGPSPDAPRIGDIIATREGEIRRITSIKGDTVDSARPIDPLTARGNKVHKLDDITPLAHDYAPEPTPQPGAAPAPGQPAAPAKPSLSIAPAAGGRFKVVDAAGNPVNSKTYATEAAAQQAIARTGKPSTFGLPPSPGGNDILDSIIENGGINLSGMSKEEAERSFPHRGIWRNELTSSSPDNTPDEIARLVAADGHGDGHVSTLWGLIDAAITERNNFRDQQAAAEKAQKAAEKAAKNQPNEPEPVPVSSEPSGQNNLPPEPAVTTAVSEGSTPAPEPSRLQEADVAKIAAEAEAAVVAARAGTKKQASTLAKEVTGAQVDAVAAAHDEGLPANYQGVRLRTDQTGKKTIAGTFNPARPFDAFLLKLADLSDHAVGILQTLQSKIGQTVTLNYGHAPEGEAQVTGGSRKKAQASSSAKDRASGEAESQAEDKNFIPLEVRFNKGTDSPSITVLGASPEKLLNNFNLARTAVTELGGEVPYRDIHDPHLVGDMKGVARNHANGWKGDGSAPIESFPDNPVQATEGYQPYPIPQERFEFLNLILGDESAKTGKRGQSPEQKLKQGLAAKNQIPMTDAGETNILRESINRAKGDVNGETWSKAMLENPLSEALRVDLINEVHPETKNEDASIRPHGYKGEIDRFFAEGSPNRTYTASGFMPQENSEPTKPATAQEKARERIAQREGPKFMPASSDLDEHGFYSQLQRTIEAKMPASAPAAQVLAIARSQGVKAEEIKWSDIDGAVKRIAAENGGKVPKKALIDYLKTDGAVRFNEVVRGQNANPNDIDILKKAGFTVERNPSDPTTMALHDAKSEDYVNADEMAGWTGEDAVPKEIVAAARRVEQAEQGKSGTQYAQQTIPGGNNYREVVLAMDSPRFWNDGSPVTKEDISTQHGRETADRVAHYGDDVFTSSHFPDAGDYVAHMRLADHHDAQGREGTLIEEEQSDRHQKGREQGYNSDKSEALKTLEANEREAKAALDVIRAQVEQDSPTGDVRDSSNRALRQQLSNAQQNHETAVGELRRADKGIPDAPMRKTWHEYLFRRALADAVTNGKQWIGWTTGETQADRYDLSKQVRGVIATKTADGTYAIDVQPKDGGGVQQLAEGIKAEKLAEHVGKDLAQKIVDKAETKDTDTPITFSGIDLKVGGEGMKGFYDNILPKYVENYVKKWGATVKKGDIKPTFEEWAKRSGVNDLEDLDPSHVASLKKRWSADDSKGTPIWQVEITPAMREGVKAGQPLFMPTSKEQPQTPQERARERLRTSSASPAPQDDQKRRGQRPDAREAARERLAAATP